MNYLSIKCDIVVLTEVKLKPTVDPKIYSLPGFNLHSCLRDHKNSKGGLLVYINSKFSQNVNSYSTNFEKLEASIRLHKQTFNIIACYRPPDSANLPDFLSSLEQSFEKLKRNLVLLGDINIDSKASTRESRKYLCLLKEFNITIANEHPTRPASGKTIDHFGIDVSEVNSLNIYTIQQDSEFSDHSTVISTVPAYNTHGKHPLAIEKTKINFSELSAKFKLTKEDFLQCNDPNLIFNKISEAIKDSVTSCSTTIRVKVKDPDKLSPWANADLLTLMKEKDKWNRKRLHHPASERNRQQYINLCVKYRQLNNSLKNKFYNNKFSTSDPKLAWKHINEVTGRGSKDKRDIECLLIDGNTISDNKDIGNKLNNFFTNIPHFQGPRIVTNPVANNTQSLPSIFLAPTSNKEVSKSIQKLRANSAAGHDGISPKIIKCLRYKLVPLMVILVNQIFASGIYPDSLKHAVVVPIYKGTGDPKDPANYRPISILSVLDKVIERILHNRLISFLTKNNILNCRQYGFRRRSNTEAAAIDLVSSIQGSLNAKERVIAIFMDLQRAFDSVYHDVLLNILHTHGIRGIALDIIRHFLTNRTQCVRVNGTISSSLPVTRGVIQGSIIGPLLFLLVINPLCSLSLRGRIILYADDAVLLLPYKKSQDIITEVRSDMTNITLLFNHLKLNLNEKKPSTWTSAASSKTRRLTTPSESTTNSI